MTIRRLLDTILDFVLPRYCPVCGSILKPDEAPLCVNCLILMPRIDFSAPKGPVVEEVKDEHVVVLGDDDVPWDSLSVKRKPRNRSFEDNDIMDRLLGKARVERAASLFWYRDHSNFAGLIYDMKYKGGRETAREAGVLLANEMLPQGFFEGIDVIVPVPITLGRMADRGYNQSLMLAKGIKKVTGIPVTDKVICRKNFNGSQTMLNATDRAANVNGGFMLVDSAPIAHRHVLLVDDLITTGATISECAKELLQAEGCRVSILTLGATAR